MTAEADFGVDRNKASGHRSYCKACDRRRGRAYYNAHRDELYAQREAVREAARQAHLAALSVTQKKKVAAAEKEHEAGVRRQRELLKSLGVPDLSPEEISARARHRAQERRGTLAEGRRRHTRIHTPRCCSEEGTKRKR
jgi:hypothetical protein